MVLAPLLPVMVLVPLWPTASMSALPVSCRCSKARPRVQLTLERTVSTPSPKRLHRHVPGVVDDVGVVAQAAGQHVGAQAAVEQVVATVAGEAVVQQVAGAVEVGAAGQRQPLEVGSQACG